MTFPDDFTFVGVTTRPRTQFELDQITRHWKTGFGTEEDVLAATGLPQPGDAHPSFTFMFVVGLSTQETGPSACALDVTYMGCTQQSGGLPVLPASQLQYPKAVQTATSGLPITGTAPTSPLTLEFYATGTQLTFFTYLTVGADDTAPDPTEDPIVIRLTSLDANYSPQSAGIEAIIANFFSLRQTDFVDSTEVVAGKFFKNVEHKTLFWGPFIFVAQLFGGNKAVAIYDPGRGYTVSDSLTLTGGSGTATLSVTSVGARDSITGFTISADTMNLPEFLIIDATGGTGSGARFVARNFP